MDLGVVKSSVSNIVHSKMADDPSFELMRYLVLNLKKDGTDVSEYAAGIRIQHLLQEYGVELETGESIYRKDTRDVLQRTLGSFGCYHYAQEV